MRTLPKSFLVVSLLLAQSVSACPPVELKHKQTELSELLQRYTKKMLDYVSAGKIPPETLEYQRLLLIQDTRSLAARVDEERKNGGSDAPVSEILCSDFGEVIDRYSLDK